jgi:hypothetical protein
MRAMASPDDYQPRIRPKIISDRIVSKHQAPCSKAPAVQLKIVAKSSTKREPRASDR